MANCPTGPQPQMATDAQATGWLRALSIAQQALLSLLAHGYLPAEIAACWRLAAVDVERRIGQLLRLLPQLMQPAPALAA